jgi:hypothetical protein
MAEFGRVDLQVSICRVTGGTIDLPNLLRVSLTNLRPSLVRDAAFTEALSSRFYTRSSLACGKMPRPTYRF